MKKNKNKNTVIFKGNFNQSKTYISENSKLLNIGDKYAIRYIYMMILI